MPTRSCNAVPRLWRRCTFALAFSSLLTLAAAPALFAQDASPAVTVGAGLQTSFVHTEPQDAEGVDQFALNSIRLYVNGEASKNIKFMFNTDYDGTSNRVAVLDAVARFEPSAKFNVWVGRFLPPSDRANLYGPYYAHHWATFQDGVQNGHPFIFQGRDNGAAYWGQFGKVKVSAGAFDGLSATGGGDDTLITAARVQVDFWDPEDGYYLNGTYYGDKNLLAIAGAVQNQGSGKNAYTADFLMERKVTGGGMYSVEAEWARYDNLGGYDNRYALSDGGFILGAYLFPQLVGAGRFEVLGRYAHARFTEGRTALALEYAQKTTELNLNYVIKQFNARLMMFYKDTRFDLMKNDFKQFGVGVQVQM